MKWMPIFVLAGFCAAMNVSLSAAEKIAPVENDAIYRATGEVNWTAFQKKPELRLRKDGKVDMVGKTFENNGQPVDFALGTAMRRYRRHCKQKKLPCRYDVMVEEGADLDKLFSVALAADFHKAHFMGLRTVKPRSKTTIAAPKASHTVEIDLKTIKVNGKEVGEKELRDTLKGAESIVVKTNLQSKMVYVTEMVRVARDNPAKTFFVGL